MADQLTLKEKQKILGSLVMKTQNKYGKDPRALAFAKDRVDDLKVTFIPTPSENVNAAMSGGFARGRIAEVAGENSSGKTSLLLETIALDMKNDPDSMWGWFETENSFDPDYAFDVKGIDPTRLMVWDMADTGAESGLDTLEMLIRSNTIKGLVVNSVAGLTPKTELDNQMDKAEVAVQARMMSKLMRKITAISGKTKTAVIFINQLRAAVGVKYGNPNITTGGKALRFFASQRIDLNKVKVKAEDGITEDQGIKVSVRIAKNRLAYDNPYKATSYTAMFGIGIDFVREVVAHAIANGVVETSGAWIYYPTKAAPETINGTECKFGSKAKFIDALRENAVLCEEIRTLTRANIKLDQIDLDEIEKIESEDKEIESEFEQFRDEAIEE